MRKIKAKYDNIAHKITANNAIFCGKKMSKIRKPTFAAIKHTIPEINGFAKTSMKFGNIFRYL